MSSKRATRSTCGAALVRPAITIAIAVGFLTTIGHGYALTGQKWRPGTTVNMQLQLGSSSSPLIDGSLDWNGVADNVMATWNQYLNGIQFASSRGSSAVSAGNGINTVTFSNTVYGQSFGSGVLAVTESMYRVSDQSFTESDVIFNTGFSWNSYRGNLRSASSGGTLVDLRRVALHEFGHVLGLDHPDDYGQNVSAVMNSHVSNVDQLQADDINGVKAIYGAVAAPAAPASPSDTLTAGGRLTPGQTLVSGNKRFRLLYQNDGNLVLYDDVARSAAWASYTVGTAGFATLQTDGNFVVYNASGAPLWATGSTGNSNARLILQGDGNMIVYNGSGQAVWDRFSAGQ